MNFLASFRNMSLFWFRINFPYVGVMNQFRVTGINSPSHPTGTDVVVFMSEGSPQNKKTKLHSNLYSIMLRKSKRKSN